MSRKPALAAVDFEQPAGEPALAPPDPLVWKVFDNPVALFAGGVAAVILELAEPRVRSGVWDFTTFRTDPIARMERTGLAAMVTVYAGRSTAEAMIAGVRRMHERIRGTTPDGTAYHANDPELLDWVNATAAFGFLEAYAAFVRPVSAAERDRYYAGGVTAARLYGATGNADSGAAIEAMLAAMAPKLEPSPIVFEFLDIMYRAPIAPGPLRPLQSMLVRAAVEITPAWVRDLLGIDDRHRLGRWERPLVQALGRLGDRIVLSSGPAAQSCRRLGLPPAFLRS